MRCSLLGIRYMRMRKISWQKTSCCFSSRKHSFSAPTHHTLDEILDVFSLGLLLERSVAPNNSSPLVHSIGSSPSPALSQTCPHHPRPPVYHLFVCGLLFTLLHPVVVLIYNLMLRLYKTGPSKWSRLLF